MNEKFSSEDKSSPINEDALFVLGWQDELTREAYECTLAKDPGRVLDLRRTEDIIAQLGTFAPALTAPTAILEKAKTQLAATPRGAAHRTWFVPPWLGWAVAACLLSILLWHFKLITAKPTNGSTTAHDDQPPTAQPHSNPKLPSSTPGEDLPTESATDIHSHSVTTTGANTHDGISAAVKPPPPNRAISQIQEIIRPNSSSFPALSPRSLSRMTIVALGPPGSNQNLELGSRATLADRVAAAVVDDPSIASTPGGLAPDDPNALGISPDPHLPVPTPTPPPTPVVAPVPVAWAIYDETNGQGSLVVADLPPLTPDEIYQFWLIDPTQPAPLSMGILPTLPAGSGQIHFVFDHPNLRPEDFRLTREPTGGSLTPGPAVILKRP